MAASAARRTALLTRTGRRPVAAGAGWPVRASIRMADCAWIPGALAGQRGALVGAVATGGLVHDLQDLLAQAPKMGFGHLYLGHIARNEGRTADAITAYQAALAATPALAEAASSLRVVQMRQSKDRTEGGGGFLKKLIGLKGEEEVKKTASS